MMKNMKSCRLCKQPKVLRQSHIIPSFVIKWIKRTSATGHLRSLENTNKRIQDGVKLPLLCDECESLFSGFEKTFSEKIFIPYVNDELDINSVAQGKIKYFEYEEWLLKFTLSVQWRGLVSSEYFGESNFPEFSNERNEFEESVRRYLLNEQTSSGNNQSYIVFLQNLAAGYGYLPSNISPIVNHYLLRSFDYTSLLNKKEFALYFKLGPIAFFTSIIPMQRKKVADIRIQKRGKIKTAQHFDNRELAEFVFITRPNEVFERYDLSNIQSTKIINEIRNNPDRFEMSRTKGAIEGDIFINQLKDI